MDTTHATRGKRDDPRESRSVKLAFVAAKAAATTRAPSALVGGRFNVRSGTGFQYRRTRASFGLRDQTVDK
jgi:hypothetical protein